MKPIYEPKGKAKEYGDYAINIYTGCPHECFYCFAPSVLRKDKNAFHSVVEPRKNIVEETRKQLEKEQITDKLIHLCFTCDPYPTGFDTMVTREIIKLLKEYGNHVQILTKGSGERDFDLLDESDWYGVTYTGYSIGVIDRNEKAKTEPNAETPFKRLLDLQAAHKRGIKTWVSFEPVLNERAIINFLSYHVDYIDKYKIGKLNYYPSDINWKDFGERVEQICKSGRLDYYIKDSLRKEMEK